MLRILKPRTTDLPMLCTMLCAMLCTMLCAMLTYSSTFASVCIVLLCLECCCVRKCVCAWQCILCAAMHLCAKCTTDYAFRPIDLHTICWHMKQTSSTNTTLVFAASPAYFAAVMYVFIHGADPELGLLQYDLHRMTSFDINT